MLDSEIHFKEGFKIQKADVFGDWDHDACKKLGNGMVVAKSDEICPVWGDRVPYKSVTVICKPEECGEVCYWLCYVHGGNSIRKQKTLKDGRIAIRSDYMCW